MRALILAFILMAFPIAASEHGCHNHGHNGHSHGQICHGHNHHGHGHRWTPGYYVSRYENVLVCHGYFSTVYVPPETRTESQDGKEVVIIVREGYTHLVWILPIYEMRLVRVWISGCYVRFSF